MRAKGLTLLLVAAAVLLTGMAEAKTSKKKGAPYIPVRGENYKEEVLSPTASIPDSVHDAEDASLPTVVGFGTTRANSMFLGEVEGGSVYEYTPEMWTAGERFLAETNWATQGVMASGCYSHQGWDQKRASERATYFFNTLLGVGRAGAANAEYDYRMKVNTSPIYYKQGLLLTRYNRADLPDSTPLVATFTVYDEGSRVSVGVGGTIQWVNKHRLMTPVVSGTWLKIRRTTHYTFSFNQATKKIVISAQEETDRRTVGGYAYLGESVQPEDHGVYAGGFQYGINDWLFRVGYTMENRFSRGTRVPDWQAHFLTGSIGRNFHLSSNWDLAIVGEFSPKYYGSVDDNQGGWYPAPGVVATINRNF